MKARPAIAVCLLLTFPASTFAQTPHRLDLKTVNLSSEPESTPVALPVLSVKPLFQQTAATQSCAESEAKGRTDADLKPLNKGWFYGSMAASAVFGLFGFGTTGVAAAVKPKPKSTPQGVDVACYSQGYGSKARNENVRASLFGNLIGTAAWFLFYATASNY